MPVHRSPEEIVLLRFFDVSTRRFPQLIVKIDFNTLCTAARPCLARLRYQVG